jgi:serine/threonine-protein kinase SRPK3
MHIVLVFEVAGRNLLSLIRDAKHRGLSPPLVKRIMLRALRGLAFLHDTCKIIHTDIKPENILLEEEEMPARRLPPPPALDSGDRPSLVRSLSDFSISSAVDLPEAERSTQGDVKGPSNSTPFSCKLADLGNACFTHQHYTADIQTRQYRSPEVILGARYDTSVDLWSLGCVCFELLTGDYLFHPKESKHFTRDDDHLAQMIELIGHFPRSAIRGEHAEDFFNRKGV